MQKEYCCMCGLMRAAVRTRSEMESREMCESEGMSVCAGGGDV